MTDRFCLLGPAEEHVAKLHELAEAGVDQFNLYLMNGDEEAQLEAYGRDVIPAFALRLPGVPTRRRPAWCDPAPPIVAAAVQGMPCGAVRSGPWPVLATRQRMARGHHAWRTLRGSSCRIGPFAHIDGSSLPSPAARSSRSPRWPRPTRPSREARAAAGVNLDQWATLDHAWQNGNLNGNNTRYPEGGIVPFRLAIEGLKAGAHTIRIQYDFTAGGHKAYDFLARYNGWVSPPICSAGGGGVSSMCPSLPGSSSAAFPSDPFKTDGLTVAGAEWYSGVERRLTIWGGTISSISGPSHAGPTGGNSSAEFVVHFTSKGSAVLLAWGGHLAQSRYWNLAAGGVRDGAGEVSGSPWHMRTLQLDGSGNRNQDRSIQPSAIVGELPPRALAAPTPTPRPTPVPPGAVAPPPPGRRRTAGRGANVDRCRRRRPRPSPSPRRARRRRLARG